MRYKNLEFPVIWIEHLPYKQGVTGSNPVVSTELRERQKFLHEFLHEFFKILFHGL